VIVELLTKAIELAANPFALAGYILLGVYSQSLWQALKYGFLWGVAMVVFTIALGGAALTELEPLVVRFVLQLIGALIITVGVFYLYRALRRPKGGGGGNGTRRPPPHLRRVK